MKNNQNNVILQKNSLENEKNAYNDTTFKNYV